MWQGSEQRPGGLQLVQAGRNEPIMHHLRSHLNCFYMLWHHRGKWERIFFLTIYPWCFAVSDGSGKTATGTICIEVPDVNDYCPVIFADSQTICIASPSVIISAKDIKDHSYGSPFTFCVVDQPPGTADLWNIRSINGKWNANLLIL